MKQQVDFVAVEAEGEFIPCVVHEKGCGVLGPQQLFKEASMGGVAGAAFPFVNFTMQYGILRGADRVVAFVTKLLAGASHVKSLPAGMGGVA